MGVSYHQDNISALEAITKAQEIAFAPVLFQTVWCLRETGVLAYLDQHHEQGVNCEDIAKACDVSAYGVSVLLDMGLTGKVVHQQGEQFFLSKIGHYLLHNPMTRVNMDFVQHTCYQAMGHLLESIRSGKPSGLKVFGDWPTIYPALSQLPDDARKSWFNFDHFYSDGAFDQALPHIFAYQPAQIYDVGGNTGKWALRCAGHNQQVKVTLLDLPPQLKLAKQNIEQAGFADRVDTFPVDVLQAESLPEDADIWWMSQFLDCFSEEQIVHILKLIRRHMKVGARVAIMELFWDRQSFEGAAISLNATSLYFTCLANGNSRFYHSKVMLNCLRQAGFYVEEDIDGLGMGHTLLICQKLSD